MKKLFTFTVLLLSLFAFENSFSQLSNHNTTLLANLDNYSGYSACWGYRAPNGREYAILGASSGTSFVDITDTTNIHEVDFVPGPNTGWREMKTYSHYAYVVTDVSALSVGVQIIDLQYLPDSVHFVKNWAPPGVGEIHTISQEGHYLYLNGGDVGNEGGIIIADLTDPENPTTRGMWDLKYVHDCRVKGDTIFACNIYSSDGGTVTIINATNKDNPVAITDFVNIPDPGPHNCAVTTDRKYCLVTDEINGNPRLLKIWDIQNLTNITQVGTWQPTNISTSRIHNVEIYGDFAVIAHYSAGIRVLDISNPLSPVEVAWYDTYPNNNNFNYSGCWGVFRFPSGKIIGSDITNGLFVINTTFPTGVEPVSNSIPSEFNLEQNYPNPFNPSTKIRFSIPENSFVSIKLYDMLGREVGSLLNETKPAGQYELLVNSNKFNLKTGTYFYTLRTENYSDTKKMILIK